MWSHKAVGKNRRVRCGMSRFGSPAVPSLTAHPWFLWKLDRTTALSSHALHQEGEGAFSIITKRDFYIIADKDEDETAQLAQLQAQHPKVAAAIALAQDFVQLVRAHQPDQLDPWLAR